MANSKPATYAPGTFDGGSQDYWQQPVAQPQSREERVVASKKAGTFEASRAAYNKKSTADFTGMGRAPKKTIMDENGQIWDLDDPKRPGYQKPKATGGDGGGAGLIGLAGAYSKMGPAGKAAMASAMGSQGPLFQSAGTLLDNWRAAQAVPIPNVVRGTDPLKLPGMQHSTLGATTSSPLPVVDAKAAAARRSSREAAAAARTAPLAGYFDGGAVGFGDQTIARSQLFGSPDQRRRAGLEKELQQQRENWEGSMGIERFGGREYKRNAAGELIEVEADYARKGRIKSDGSIEEFTPGFNQVVPGFAAGGAVPPLLPPDMVVPPNYEFMTQRALSPEEIRRIEIDAAVARALGRVPQKPTSGGTITRNGVVTRVAPSYSQGGYTGPGDKYQPAGVVHAGEFVIPKEEVAKIGVPALDAYFGTDSTKPKSGYAGGGAPPQEPLDLSSLRVQVPAVVREAANRLSQSGAKSNQEILNALTHGAYGFEAILSAAKQAESTFQKTYAQGDVATRRGEAENAVKEALAKIEEERVKLDTKWATNQAAYEKGKAEYDTQRVKALADQLKRVASSPATREALNAEHSYSGKGVVDSFVTDTAQTRKSLNLPLYNEKLAAADPRIDRQFESAAALLMTAVLDPKDPLAGYVKSADAQIKGTKGAALLQQKAEIDALDAQRKQLATAELRLATDPTVARAEKQLAAAEERAARLGPVMPGEDRRAVGEAAPAPRISAEASRAVSVMGGPVDAEGRGGFFSPYVINEATGFPKKFATREEALAAATGVAPAPLAEFMGTPAAAPVQEEMYVPSAEEEMGLFPSYSSEDNWAGADSASSMAEESPSKPGFFSLSPESAESFGRTISEGEAEAARELARKREKGLYPLKTLPTYRYGPEGEALPTDGANRTPAPPPRWSDYWRV